MTEGEQRLLRTASEAIMQLVRDQADMVAGLTAVFLDLYQVEFQESRQSKAEVLFRLRIQRDRLAQHSARQNGVKFLDSLIQTVEKAQLQPAKALGARQLHLRDELSKGGDEQTSEANGEPPPRISSPQEPAPAASRNPTALPDLGALERPRARKDGCQSADTTARSAFRLFHSQLGRTVTEG
jgi:hypothetical protein